MDFKEAVKAMKEGKKVRRDKATTKVDYTYANTKGIITRSDKQEDEPHPYITLEEAEATDWQIVGEKTLSEELSIYTPAVINEVGEAIKRFIDKLCAKDRSHPGCTWREGVEKDAKEVFGDKLT